MIVNISNLCSSSQYINIQKADLNPSAVHYNWAVIFKNTIFTQELADRKHPECGKQHKRLSQSFVCRHNLSVKEADVVPQICCFILTKVFSCCQADSTHRQRGSLPRCRRMFVFKMLVVSFLSLAVTLWRYNLIVKLRLENHNQHKLAFIMCRPKTSWLPPLLSTGLSLLIEKHCIFTQWDYGELETKAEQLVMMCT